jgi:soluble lytic murein transglycosylase-like protein
MCARDRWDALLIRYGEQYSVPWQLLKAQMLAESGGDPEAVSPAGAVGLAQFMLPTWEEWADPGWERTEPEHSLETQARYMAWLLKQFDGRYRCALAAYNWGIGRVWRMLRKNAGSLDVALLPAETRSYLQRIDDLMGGFDYA